MMKSFRFKMSTGSNDFAPPERVRLATNQGLIGYKITKLQLIPKDPTDASHEAVVQVFATRPGGNNPGDTDEIDFGNPSSLKNINYIDISMKGNATPEVFYAINNKELFSETESAWIQFPNSHELSNTTFKTYRYKLNTGSIKNINSIRLKILDQSSFARSFELNDITIVYREKQL